MKRLIALLLLAPVVASAQTFDVTSGSGGASDDEGAISFVGKWFSGIAAGGNCTPCGNFFLSPGDHFSFIVSDNFAFQEPSGTGSMSVTVSNPGPVLVEPFDASGLVQISGGSFGPITHPGTYRGFF